MLFYVIIIKRIIIVFDNLDIINNKLSPNILRENISKLYIKLYIKLY